MPTPTKSRCKNLQIANLFFIFKSSSKLFADDVYLYDKKELDQQSCAKVDVESCFVAGLDLTLAVITSLLEKPTQL